MDLFFENQTSDDPKENSQEGHNVFLSIFFVAGIFGLVIFLVGLTNKNNQAANSQTKVENSPQSTASGQVAGTNLYGPFLPKDNLPEATPNLKAPKLLREDLKPSPSPTPSPFSDPEPSPQDEPGPSPSEEPSVEPSPSPD